MDTVSITLPRLELEQLLASRSRFLSSETRRSIREQLCRRDEDHLAMHLGWMDEADRALPLLQAALVLGTYVRTTDVSPGGSDSRFIVVPKSTDVSGVACKILETRGILTQTVGKTNRGWTLRGVRLRPKGDERWMVEEAEVYLQAGRCAKCGYTPEQTRDRTRAGLCSHEFASDYFSSVIMSDQKAS